MQAGVVRQVRTQAVARAKRARAQVALLLPLIASVVLAYSYRHRLFGLDLPIRILCVIALVILGWAFAMNLGRAIGPVLLKRLEPGTAGTVGFLIRLATLAITVLAALRLAGLQPETLAVGGAITAVILGLAAQQTVGNLIAGTVLLSARPFRVGDRIRVHAGGVAGTVEGTVTSLGLLYTTLANRADRIMVPNNVVLSAAVVPLREPDGVDLRARLRPVR
jgi:small conductance mechanosensitive channel